MHGQSRLGRRRSLSQEQKFCVVVYKIAYGVASIEHGRLGCSQGLMRALHIRHLKALLDKLNKVDTYQDVKALLSEGFLRGIRGVTCK